jgi:ribulose bisphosphate carboxylase small subunit
MKIFLFIACFLLVFSQDQMAQEVGDSILYIPWKKVVLNNEASFKSFNDLTWGAGFLIKYNNDTIAVTARDLTGTWYNNSEKISINDFKNEIKFWKMYVADHPDQYVMLDTLMMKTKIEKSAFIFFYSVPFLSFSIVEKDKNIVPLNPNVSRIHNKDTLYLIGYDNDHNLKIVESIVETPLNEKYAEPDIRVKTNEYSYYDNFIGAPMVNKNGDVVGIINRAYVLKKSKKGKIIREDKEVEGSYYEYFVNGTAMRLILGKDYGKK